MTMRIGGPNLRTHRTGVLTRCAIVSALAGLAWANAAAAQEETLWEPCPALGASRPESVGQVSVVADDYPLVSMALREEGRAVVDVDVGADGTVADVRVAESTGSFRLDEQSVAIVHERWRFQPGLLGGAPVACTTQVAVRWDLTNFAPLTDGAQQQANQISEELLRLLGIQGTQ